MANLNLGWRLIRGYPRIVPAGKACAVVIVFLIWGVGTGVLSYGTELQVVAWVGAAGWWWPMRVEGSRRVRLPMRATRHATPVGLSHRAQPRGVKGCRDGSPAPRPPAHRAPVRWRRPHRIRFAARHPVHSQAYGQVQRAAQPRSVPQAEPTGRHWSRASHRAGWES